MAEFKISRFRYTWRGNWVDDSSVYYKDDVVFHRGIAWVCIRQHTSSNFGESQSFTFPGDTFPSPAWVKMIDGRQFLGEWSANTTFDPGTLIISGGNVYLCLISHESSTNFNSDLSNWEIFAVGANFRNIWEPDNRYRVGDVIRYNGYTYQCILEHTSGSNEQGVKVGNNDTIDDSTAETWKIVAENYTYVGSYQPSTIYRINDLVKYGGSILKCTVEHTSSSIPGQIQNLNFQTYLSGFKFDIQWSQDVFYSIGDVVRYGGTLYAAATNNFGGPPGISAGFQEGNPDWYLISDAIDFKGPYVIGDENTYRRGDLVRRGGALWVKTAEETVDYSTLKIFDLTNWELVLSAYNFRSSWTDSTYYNVYDVVYFRGTLYYANVPHISNFDNFPGDNGEGFFYWDILAVGDSDAALNDLGDLLTFNLSRFRIGPENTGKLIGDGSTFGPTVVPIGEEEQLLVVENNQGDLGYKFWGDTQRIFYVNSLIGIDDDTEPRRGTNVFKPFKTVRYALRAADDDFEGFTTISVSTGEYQEVLPLIVPKRTAVVGDELRSTTIRAGDPIPALANDAPYTIQTLLRLGTIIDNIILGTSFTKSVGNLLDPDISVKGTEIEVAIANDAWSSAINVIDFKVNDNGSYPVVSGTNTAVETADNVNARQALENNREFLKSEAIAFMAANNPSYAFDVQKCRRDIDEFIDALKYDINHPGNYKSVLAGRYYANAVIGSQLEDMFYVRDSSGIRNLTLKGLNGTLPDLQEGQVYRIPTGGAYVSLDPGWGPADDRVWIIERSCYVQNVTTFGTGASGQKVDGDLHNEGNKSIVSNDFTQVISDGIGAWVLNGGRAELVSVFSYYAHIGMFALNGGTIRATNGNSSYGDFGTVADGIDPDEVVRFGYLNTRLTDAEVAAAFAGEVNDFILALEFNHCGQEYTEASYSIRSSGTGAVAIQEEFRDNSMFQCQVRTPGSSFRQFGNQAQFGNTLTITLATAELASAPQILGMRIIIISGEGTGQYGYVQAYNAGTKLCTVYRESDDQPGWDNILPGTPPRDLLTTGTRYRIEPRPIFSDPGFSAFEITLGTGGSWSGLVYGETSGTFVGVEGSSGTGTTIDLLPQDAQFTIIKTGRKYSITLTNGGAGYSVGDQIVIDGSDVGGISGEHDIELTVLDISDDSTNSVLSFQISNIPIADSGKFILTPSTGSFGSYSPDGENWTPFNMPSAGNWACLTAGDNKFVAIIGGDVSSNSAGLSLDGVNWSSTNMPATRIWSGVAYGKPSTAATGIFVAVARNLNSAAYSINGGTWISSTLPTFGDSTLNEYVDIAFGGNVFVALANSGNIVSVGTWNGTSLSWQGSVMDVIDDSSAKDWVSITYGNGRFVAISSTGEVSYSFDGLDWSPAELPTEDGSTIHNWKEIRYGQGVFFAVGDTGSRDVGGDPTTGPTTFAATSYDGIVWTSRTLASSLDWNLVAFGNPDITLGDSTASNGKPTWVVASSTSSSIVNKIYTGAKALGRVVVDGSGIARIKIWEPGSGYDSLPSLTIIDPNKTIDPEFITRLADGVIAQPKFISKGSAYKTSTTFVTITGDGFADVTPLTQFITLDRLSVIPGPGAQLYIGGRTDFFVATVVGIDSQDLPDGTLRSTFRVSPRPDINDYLEHDMEVLIRERYSQVRITGHDFLDVGSGNFEETNYPELYVNYDYDKQPFQEVQNLNGGRVFYTSTDQDGNFRAGQQFAVEQATGIITISADFFDLGGLTELRLGGVTVGSTAVIREFSKDPLFLQDSNNVIPTQRAIVAYLQSRLNIGGEDLLTPSIIAGTVKVGPNLIDNTAGLSINFPVIMDFNGNGAGIDGSILGLTMFYRGFRNV